MNIEKAILKFQDHIGSGAIDLERIEPIDLVRMKTEAHIIGSMSRKYKSLYKDPHLTCPLYLRVELILEEISELLAALGNGDEVEILDACVDSVYVIVGTATALGLPFMEAFEEVHRSNMTKGTAAADHDGDKGKGLSYSPPDIQSIIERNKF